MPKNWNNRILNFVLALKVHRNTKVTNWKLTALSLYMYIESLYVFRYLSTLSVNAQNSILRPSVVFKALPKKRQRRQMSLAWKGTRNILPFCDDWLLCYFSRDENKSEIFGGARIRRISASLATANLLEFLLLVLLLLVLLTLLPKIIYILHIS